MENNIKVEIGEHKYSFKADPAIEELYRRAAASINSRLERYRTKYPDKSAQDILSFVAFLGAVNELKLKTELEETKRQISELDQSLLSYLDERQ